MNLWSPSATALHIEMKAASRSIVKVERKWASTMFVSAETVDEPEDIARSYVENWNSIMRNFNEYHKRKAELSPGCFCRQKLR